MDKLLRERRLSTLSKLRDWLTIDLERVLLLNQSLPSLLYRFVFTPAKI
jgi:hypothetical protein